MRFLFFMSLFFCVQAKEKRISHDLLSIFPSKSLTENQKTVFISYGLNKFQHEKLFTRPIDSLFLLRRYDHYREPVGVDYPINEIALPDFKFYNNKKLEGKPVLIKKNDGIYDFKNNIIFPIQKIDKDKAKIFKVYNYETFAASEGSDPLERHSINFPIIDDRSFELISIHKEHKISFEIRTTINGKDKSLFFRKHLLKNFQKLASVEDLIKGKYRSIGYKSLTKEYLDMINNKKISKIKELSKNCGGLYPFKWDVSTQEIEEKLLDKSFLRRIHSILDTKNWFLVFNPSVFFENSVTRRYFPSFYVFYRENDLGEYYHVNWELNSLGQKRNCLFIDGINPRIEKK